MKSMVSRRIGSWKTYRYVDGLGGNGVFDILQDGEGVLWFATRGGVSRFDGVAWKTYTTQHGLPSNHVYRILRDSQGQIWAIAGEHRLWGYPGMLNRLDGERWVSYTTQDGPASDGVNDLLEAADGTLWLATEGGVSRFDGYDWTTYTTRDGLMHNRVYCVFQERDGPLWFGTESGLSCFDGSRWRSYAREDGLALDTVLAILQDQRGMLWFGGKGNCVSGFDGRCWTNHRVAHAEVRFIFLDSRGMLWFAGGYLGEGGVTRFDGASWANHTTQDGLASDIAYRFIEDTRGRIWVGTGGFVESAGGVSCFDGEGWTTYTVQDGLAGYINLALFQDREGIFWFGDYNAGLSRFDEASWIDYTTQGSWVDNRVHTIAQDRDGAFWFGTDGGGVRWYDGSSWGRFTTEDGLAGDEVYAIFQDGDGAFWFGTYEDGLSCFDGESWTNYTEDDGLQSVGVLAIFQDRAGMLWFGTRTGVRRLDGDNWTVYRAEEGAPESEVNAIGQDREGRLWFMDETALYRFDGTHWQSYPQQKGGGSANIGAIFQDRDGVLWIGGYNGLSRLNGEEWTTYTIADGLAANDVTVIAQDSEGTLWIGTHSGGVSRFDGSCFQTLNSLDGLPDDTIRSLCIAADGHVWFGMQFGLARFTPNKVPPSVTLTQIRADDKMVPTKQESIRLDAGVRRLAISYRGVSLKTRPGGMIYRYRLEGRDTDWQKPTREETAEYFDLKAGSYTFQMQAIDRDLNSSELLSLRVTVPLDPRDLEIAALQTEVSRLRREVSRKYDFSNIVGRSAPIKQVYALMERAIDSGLTVLLSGETGTGKEMAAKAIHYNSPRRDYPLQDLNCGAIPRDLVASTLFGYCRGAFTGARQDTPGLFETASGGTVLLDEIAEMPAEAQVHLLRVLQERKVQRIGENRSRDVDVRIIAITNRDLTAEVESGRFREDLYYRLSVFPIHLPALREHLEDIPFLAEHFLEKVCHQLNKELEGFTPGVMEMLQSYPWPGNVRELENEIHRAAAFVEEGLQIHTYHFSSRITRGESLIQDILSERVNYSESMDRFRRRLIEEALHDSDGNRSEAARRLGMKRPNLVALIRRLGIEG